MRRTLAPDRVAALLTAGIAAAILAGTLSPPGAMPEELPGSDKLQHLIAFAALVLPLTVVRPARAVWVVPLAVACGGAIELVQPLVGRSAEWADLAANAAGAAIGAALGWIGNRLWRRLRSRAG